MEQNIALALNYVRMVWRYRWVALVTGTTICLLGWAVVALLPNQYEVTAKVYLDTRTLLKPLLKGLAIDADAVKDSTLLMRRTLLVRPNLEQVARKTDMDLKAKTPEDFERLLTSLAKRISVKGTARDNIFVIGFRDSSAQLANKVVEAILNLFVERSLGESRKDTSKTKQFIERQIAEYEARLQAAENRLKEFKQRNIGLMPSEGKGYYQRLQDQIDQLKQAQLDLLEAQNRVAAIKGQLAGERPTLKITPGPGAGEADTGPQTPFDLRIQELESSLDQLLLRYTDKHPDVISSRRLLAELKAKRDAYLEELAAQAGDGDGGKAEAPSGPAYENPAYKALTASLAEAKAEVAALQARVLEYKGRAEELKKRVDTIPQIEAELANLNRDYEINKKNYDELVKRREALKIGQEAGETTDSVQFNVIEPPRVPLVPVSPNRPLLSAAVFVAGVGSGVGLALLLALLRPAIYTRDSIREFTDLPVLGVVSRLWTPRERLRRRLEVTTFAVGCLFLAGVFGGLIALYQTNPELLDRLHQLDVSAKLQALKDQYL